MLSVAWPPPVFHVGGQTFYVVVTGGLLALAALLPWLVRQPTPVSRQRRLAWVVAITGLAMALLPPLEHLADRSLAAHMGQHVLLLFVVAPLLVRADPVTASVRSLPADRRRGTAQLLGRVRRVGHLPPVVLAMSLVHVTVVLGWHLPTAYTAAVRWPVVHATEHVQFLLAGALFWWAVRESSRRGHAAEMAAAWTGLAVVTVSGVLLGLMMTFASQSWYPSYDGVPEWGLSAVEDQQTAGAVMWATGGPAYLLAALVLLDGALKASPRASDPEDSRRPATPAR